MVVTERILVESLLLFLANWAVIIVRHYRKYPLAELLIVSTLVIYPRFFF